MLDAFSSPGIPFPERLVEALRAADSQGGDRRGRQSAAVSSRRDNGGYGGNNDNWIDLRVDDDPAPMERLAAMLDLVHLYRDRPRPEDLLAIDESLAADLRSRLTAAGYSPERLTGKRSLAEVLAGMDVERTGEPRETPASWSDDWESALAEWMSVENLEER